MIALFVYTMLLLKSLNMCINPVSKNHHPSKPPTPINVDIDWNDQSGKI